MDIFEKIWKVIKKKIKNHSIQQYDNTDTKILWIMITKKTGVINTEEQKIMETWKNNSPSRNRGQSKHKSNRN